MTEKNCDIYLGTCLSISYCVKSLKVWVLFVIAPDCALIKAVFQLIVGWYSANMAQRSHIPISLLRNVGLEVRICILKLIKIIKCILKKSFLHFIIWPAAFLVLKILKQIQIYLFLTIHLILFILDLRLGAFKTALTYWLQWVLGICCSPIPPAQNLEESRTELLEDGK